MDALYFVVNPLAKNGYGLTIWEKAERELMNAGIPFQVFLTEYAGHAKEIVEYIGNKESEATVIAVGGDGTLHEVVNGAIRFPQLRISMIPGGSGNDFAREFQIPKRAEPVIQFLLQKLQTDPTFIDVGKTVNSQMKERYFINNMGAGFDALVAYDANKSRLKAWFNRFNLGTIIYAVILLKQLFSYRCSNVNIKLDGERYHFPNTWFVTVANQPFYGGGMMISPSACPEGGELNIIVVHNLSKLKFLAVFISVFWGGHVRFKEVIELKGKRITITPSEPMYVHTDGEYAGKTPIKVEVVHKKLRVFTGRNQ